MSGRREEEDIVEGEESDDKGQEVAVEVADSHDDMEGERVISWATAIADHVPSPYDTQGLSFKAGQEQNKFIKYLDIVYLCRAADQDSPEV